VAYAKTEILIILNSDVQPEPDFIAPLVQPLQDTTVFSVSPLILNESGDVSGFSLNNYSIQFGRLKRLRQAWNQHLSKNTRFSLYASGGSMAVRKSMFLALDGFLPIFKPFYGEDFDLGIRAWRRGWSTLLEPSSVIVHQESGSIKENHARKRIRRTLQRNKLLVEWLHLPSGMLALTAPLRLLLRILVKILIADIGHLQAVYEALTRLPEVWRLRQSFAAQHMSDFNHILENINRKNYQSYQTETASCQPNPNV
jgi:GT2 family glycosyltransferase